MQVFDLSVVGMIVLALTFLVLMVRESLRQQGDFEERFPPISDEEFLARCTPGTNPRVALKVREIVAEHLGVDYYRIHPSTRFAEDLGAD